MKYIQKQEEPSSLKEWKQQTNENWQPSYGTLGNQRKDSIKEALMKEQGYLCCYCEQELTLNDSHIEPFLDETLSIEDIQLFVKGYLYPSNDGKFGEFWTTIDYLFGTYVDED